MVQVNLNSIKHECGMYSPYTQSEGVTGLSQTDLLRDNHSSVFETATCMQLICCMPTTELPQVCHMPVIYLFWQLLYIAWTAFVHGYDRLLQYMK